MTERLESGHACCFERIKLHGILAFGRRMENHYGGTERVDSLFRHYIRIVGAWAFIVRFFGTTSHDATRRNESATAARIWDSNLGLE